MVRDTFKIRVLINLVASKSFCFRENQGCVNLVFETENIIVYLSQVVL